MAVQITYATARHVVVALGVRLELSPPAAKGRPTVSELLSPTDAKRLAWGILADLDPIQGAAAHATEPDPQAQSWRTALEARRRQRAELKRQRAERRRPSPRPRTGRRIGQIGPATQAGRLLAALREGERRGWELEAMTGVSTLVIGARMIWLRQRGLVARTDGGGAGTPALYAITDAGRAMLGEMGADE
jgi:hypothetical protein